MSVSVQSRYSGSIGSLPWNVALGIVDIRGVDTASLQPALVSLAASVVADEQDKRERLARRMGAFGTYFAANNCRSPLGAQFEAMQRKETPRGSGLVQALLLLEMSTGLLMGAQDAAAIKGELLCDVATQGETFRGMRNEVQCQEGELVLRDSESIIAALFQGPDHRTRLKKETKDVVFFVFSVPGITVNEVQEGIEAVRALFQGACAEISAQLYESGTHG